MESDVLYLIDPHEVLSQCKVVVVTRPTVSTVDRKLGGRTGTEGVNAKPTILVTWGSLWTHPPGILS